MNKCIIALFSLILSINAQANLTVKPCDDDTTVDAEYVVAMKTYYNKAVKIFHVDTDGEPACCSSTLLVYVPDPNLEINRAKCFQVTEGVLSIDFKNITSKYIPKVGLVLTFPYTVYNHDPEEVGNVSKPAVGSIIINAKKAQVFPNNLSKPN